MRTKMIVASSILLAMAATGCTSNQTSVSPVTVPTMSSPATTSTTITASSTASHASPATTPPKIYKHTPLKVSPSYNYAVNNWYSNWTAIANSGKFSAYTTATSDIPGHPITLRVNNTLSNSYIVQAYRIGYYKGVGAKKVWQSGNIKSTKQPYRKFIHALSNGAIVNSVSADDWKNSFSIATKGWKPGEYILKLITPKGDYTYVPYTVRSTSFAGTSVIVAATTTYQAYNRWGGASAYYGIKDGGNPGQSTEFQGDERSALIDYNRPYDVNGLMTFFKMEVGLIQEADRLGIPLSYTTDTDTEKNVNSYVRAKAIITLAHDEYWSSQRNIAMTKIRDTGVNYIDAGGDIDCWRIRWADKSYRHYYIFKDTKDFVTAPEDEVTVNVNPAITRALVGNSYAVSDVKADYRISNPDSWVFFGTGVKKGTTFPNLLNGEIDQVDQSWFSGTPADLQIMNTTPFVDKKGQLWRSDFTYYVAPSGAGVVDMSNFAWGYAMESYMNKGKYGIHLTTAGIVFAKRVWDNILYASAAGPMGKYEPKKVLAAKYKTTTKKVTPKKVTSHK